MGCADKPAEREFYKYNREFKNNAFIILAGRNSGEGCQLAITKKKTPTKMSCWQVFEPGVQSGRLLASSGFSE